jgi:hypothetical protein
LGFVGRHRKFSYSIFRGIFLVKNGGEQFPPSDKYRIAVVTSYLLCYDLQPYSNEKPMKKIYNPKHRHVQKRFFKQKVKGEYRSLAWSKNVYREWFRYAQLSPLNYPKDFGDLSEYGTESAYIDIHPVTPKIGRLYKDEDLEFNQWWKEKMDLFYEPPEQHIDRIVTKINPNEKEFQIDKNHLYLQINLSDLDKAVIEFNKVMVKEYYKQKEARKKFKFQSKAKYYPSLPQKNIRLQKLMIYRLAYDLKFKQNKSRIDIVIHLTENGMMKKSDIYDDDRAIYENNQKLGKPAGDDIFFNEVKRVSFFLGKAKSIFKNIELGLFP